MENSHYVEIMLNVSLSYICSGNFTTFLNQKMGLEKSSCKLVRVHRTVPFLHSVCKDGAFLHSMQKKRDF